MPPLQHPITALLALLLSTGSGLATSAAMLNDPGNTGTFRYTVQPGDSAWNITARYLRTTDHWQALRLRHHLQGDRLQPGQVLDIPMSWLKLTTPQATLTGLVGEVQLRHGAGDWLAAQANTVLPPGAWLRTRHGGTATLMLQDGTRVLVRSDSELRLMPLDQTELERGLKTWSQTPPAAGAGASGAPVRIELLQGGLENAVQPQTGGNRFEIHTPSAVTTVRGTEFRVFATAGTSRAEVVHGAVGFHNPLGEVELGMATGSQAAQGLPPIAAVPLLPAPDVQTLPDLLAPEQARQIPLPTVAGAHAYRIQWFSPDSPGHLLHETISPVTPTSPINTTSQTGFPDLPDGAYRWRIRAIDAKGFEGLSAERTLTITTPRPPEPPLRLEAAKVGQRLELRWTQTDMQASFQVQVARDAAFGTVVLDELTPHMRLSLPLPSQAVPHHVRVRTLHPDGRSSAWSEPRLISPHSLQELSP